MLGVNELDVVVERKLEELYRIFKMENARRGYSWHILQLFFIIKIVIFSEKSEQEETDKIE